MITAEQNVQAMREMRDADERHTAATRRSALVQHYDDKASAARAVMEEAELMARTVRFLDDDSVELEWRNKVKHDR